MSKSPKSAEESPGRNKMLRKAFSFRDDFKGLIRRTPSITSAGQRSPSPAKRVKSRTSSRCDSSEDQSRAHKLTESLDDTSLCRTKSMSVDKLQRESRKVFQALRYIHGVVDKNTLQMLPGSASIVLETVMEMNTLLSNYFINQQSTLLTSMFDKLYQSLANLIKWADSILINGASSLDPKSAHETITAVDEVMKDILQLAADKLQNKGFLTLPRKSSRSPSVKNVSPSTGQDSPQRTSLPDIPLTPREKEILQQTSLKVDPTGADNNNTVITNGEPPPKPPLPSERVPVILSHHNSPTDGDEPPPLPVKRRSSATDSLTGGSTPASANQSPQHVLYNVVNIDTGLLNANMSQSPLNLSPTKSLTDSETSSLLGSGDVFDNDGPVVVRKSRTVKYNLSPGYDNVDVASPFSDLNDLTLKISQLTSSIDGQVAPPIPQKQRERAGSNYDNLTEMTEKKVVQISGTGQRSTQIKTSGSGSNLIASTVHESSTMHKSSSFTQSMSFREGATSSQQWSQSSSSSRQFQQTFGTGTNGGFNTDTFSAFGNNVFPSQFPPFQNPNNIFPEGTNMAPGGTLKFSAVGGNQRFGQVSGTGPDNSQFQASMGQKTQFRQNALKQQIGTNSHLSSHESFSSTETFSSLSTTSMESLQRPPPLPPKKKHVEAYMEMFGNYKGGNYDFARHSIHSMNYFEEQWYQHQMELFHPRSHTVSVMSTLSSDNSDVLSIGSNDDPFASIAPVLPPKRKSAIVAPPSTSSSEPGEDEGPERSASMVVQPSSPLVEDKQSEPMRHSLPVKMSIKQQKAKSSSLEKDVDSDFSELNTLDDVDVSDQLVRKKQGEDGPDIRGGTVDALIVHATHVSKHDFMYQEAFLTTYRTFISPENLIGKLLYRYRKFSRMIEDNKKRLSRNAFSLLVRVIDELCGGVDDKVLELLMQQVFELLCDGELMLARILRRKILEKCEDKTSPSEGMLPTHTLTAKPLSLTDFKSQELAEQMTLLDAELFQKIEIPEVLLWSKEQKEELSPNLTLFTEHFNKMSYWCRTRIIEHEDAKDRERYLMKFIKIMKHLRKLNNFNSYLAILSAVDSAPIRRLEWQKQNMEMLKEFCQLIDSSSSFRAYRQALAETEPPCIPYIGLILQDLTFVHIGNQDFLPDGNVNFAKRWQQFNILECMRRFKKCDYSFKKNPKVITFFCDFDDYLCEESLWQISELIKPRGGKKKTSM